jgi:hypothetical protein
VNAPLLVGHVERIEVPLAVVTASWRHVARRGDGRREAIVVWAGRVDDVGARIVAAVAPPLEEIQARALWHHLSARAHARMSRWMQANGLIALAQVHTHPDAWVGHSETDDAYPFAPDVGFWSIVWPGYAMGQPAPLTAWGVHERREAGWHQLSKDEVQHRLVITQTELTEERALVEAT